jgi:hypothetical protein
MSRSRTRSAAVGLAGAGLLLGIGGALHPRVDTHVEYEHGLAGMYESSGPSPLFVGSAGLSIWFVVSGIRTARRLSGGEIDRKLGMAPAR